MKKTMALCSLLMMLAGVGVSQAQAAEKTLTPQQQRMSACNQQAAQKSLKGDERKSFMSSCLKGQSGSDKGVTVQQNKMKTCNAEAGKKALKGDERKTFMSNCLKKKG